MNVLLLDLRRVLYLVQLPHIAVDTVENIHSTEKSVIVEGRLADIVFSGAHFVLGVLHHFALVQIFRVRYVLGDLNEGSEHRHRLIAEFVAAVKSALSLLGYYFKLRLVRVQPKLLGALHSAHKFCL